jgi:hypothetical protein
MKAENPKISISREPALLQYCYREDRRDRLSMTESSNSRAGSCQRPAQHFIILSKFIEKLLKLTNRPNAEQLSAQTSAIYST